MLDCDRFWYAHSREHLEQIAAHMGCVIGSADEGKDDEDAPLYKRQPTPIKYKVVPDMLHPHFHVALEGVRSGSRITITRIEVVFV